MGVSFELADDDVMLVAKFIGELVYRQKKYPNLSFEQVSETVMINANQQLSDLSDPRKILATETSTNLYIEIRDSRTGDVQYSYGEDLSIAKRGGGD